MPAHKLNDLNLSVEELQRRVDAYHEYKSHRAAAKALGIGKSSFGQSILRAAEIGMLGTKPVLPGYAIKQISSKDEDGAWVKQTKEHGGVFETPDGHIVKGVSALVDESGREVIKWVKTSLDTEYRDTKFRAAIEALKEDLPRAGPIAQPTHTLSALLNQFTVTDLHFGMLSWAEETGADYDLKIAEKLLLDWFAAAIALAPPAKKAVFAQIGDLLHYDGFEAKTPTSGHILDADSRIQKVVRVVLRTIRKIIRMLLEKHDEVHVIMADANHDPYAEAWLRELFAMHYEDEPRLTVDNSADSYYCVEHGDTSLFYHHGHKRKVGNVDSVFAGKYREVFGRTKFSYAHLGHLHSDELKSTNLMKVERHETLAAPDAYSSKGGWLSGRSAKVITYHEKYGEVGRNILTPEMVEGWCDAQSAD